MFRGKAERRRKQKLESCLHKLQKHPLYLQAEFEAIGPQLHFPYLTLSKQSDHYFLNNPYSTGSPLSTQFSLPFKTTPRAFFSSLSSSVANLNRPFLKASFASVNFSFISTITFTKPKTTELTLLSLITVFFQIYY